MIIRQPIYQGQSVVAISYANVSMTGGRGEAKEEIGCSGWRKADAIIALFNLFFFSHFFQSFERFLVHKNEIARLLSLVAIIMVNTSFTLSEHIILVPTDLPVIP